MKTTIELAKKRDFGEIISDTFLFVRENFGPLLKCFFIFCGFFIVGTIVFGWLFETHVLNETANISANPDSFNTPSSVSGAFSQILGVPFILFIGCLLLGHLSLLLTVTSYMAVYKVKGNIPPEPVEVWGYYKYYFFRILGMAILITVLLIMAFICCIIPGIWLYPILSLIFPIIIVENVGLNEAFGKSFRIISDNWWQTFGAFFVIGIIVSILSAVIKLPFGAINIADTLLHRGNFTRKPQGAIISSLIIDVLCQVFYILPFITTTICYFSLTEEKDDTGLMERINQLGNNTDNTDLPAEEF